MDNRITELLSQDLKDSIYEVQYELNTTREFIDRGLDKLNQDLEDLKALCKELREGKNNDR